MLEESTESWLARTRAEGESNASPSAESDSTAVAPSEAAREGWDPWEVWLRRIEQPRRRRIGDTDESSD
jgi:hypothetical protein